MEGLVIKTEARAISRTPTAPPETCPDTAQASDMTAVEKVFAKEDAVKESFTRLSNIRRRFEETNLTPAGLNTTAWNAKLGEIMKEHSDFEYLVGVGGDTGLGKTSLLNALLNPKSEIAPSSQAGACTAAVCLFRHHEPKDPEKAFLAVARFKSKATVDESLKEFFTELEQFRERSTGTDTRDSVYRGELARFNVQIDLISSWSGLDTDRIRELGKTGKANEITTQCTRASRLFNLEDPTISLSEEIYNSRPARFLKAVKPYAGGTRSKADLLWPLVEVVEFYLSTDNVLRHGITLVDLPGEMDALESRSKVAQTYYQKLDQLMVVTPGDRAADNRTAMDLLREDQILDMDANGKTESLCVVITKVDLMNWLSFVENEWNAEDISPDFPAHLQRYDLLQAKLQRIAQQIESVRSKEDDDDVEDQDETEEDHRFEAEFVQTVKGATLEVLLDMQKALDDEVSLVNAKCLRACIDVRTQNSKKKFQDHFDRVRNSANESDSSHVSTQLDVFPVSSHAHRRLATSKCMPGFPDAEATGFQALEEWLIQGSLKKRGKLADRILRRCRVMIDEISSWIIMGASTAHKLPETELSKLQWALNCRDDRFRKSLEAHRKQLHASIADLRPNMQAGWDAWIEGRTRFFVAHIRDYAKDTTGEDLHYGTYAALVRRCGGNFRSFARGVRRDHDWQARTDRILGSLDSLKHVRIQTIEGSRVLHENYKAAFEGQAQNVVNICNDHIASVEGLVTQYLEGMAAIRTESRQWLCDSMKKGYEEAQAIHGTGSYVAMKKTMVAFAEEAKQAVFATTTRRLAKRMKEMLKTLVGQHENLDEELASTLARLEDNIAHSICYNEQTRLEAARSMRKLNRFKGSLCEETDEFEACWSRVAHILPAEPVRVHIKEEASVIGPLNEEELVMWEPEANSFASFVPAVAGTKRQPETMAVRPRKVPKIEVIDD